MLNKVFLLEFSLFLPYSSLTPYSQTLLPHWQFGHAFYYDWNQTPAVPTNLIILQTLIMTSYLEYSRPHMKYLPLWWVPLACIICYWAFLRKFVKLLHMWKEEGREKRKEKKKKGQRGQWECCRGLFLHLLNNKVK